MELYCKNNKPYIYAAFPEDKKVDVLPVLESLNSEGVQFWYADKYDKKERRRIAAAFGVILFATKDFSESERFKAIVDDAVLFNQNILCIYLEDVTKTPWIEMQLGSQQALSAYVIDDAFIAKLKEAFIFQKMKVTFTQKLYQKRRAITAIALPLLAAAILFFAVINPLLIAPTAAVTKIAQQWGLSMEDLESITELHIVGNEVVDYEISVQYSGNNRSELSYGQDYGDWASSDFKTSSGELTSDDLSILKYMPNLEVLEISGQQITDISAVFDTNVKRLNLSCNPITSLEGIEKMQSLTELILVNTDITDISPATSLVNLEKLQIDGTHVSDLSGIENLKKLNALLIRKTNIRSLPALGEIENLSLDLREMNIKDLKGLANVKSISSIYIDNLPADEVTYYLSGKEIAYIGITNVTNIADLYGLNMVDGGHIGIANSYLTNLDGIEYFENISALDIHHNMNGSVNYLTDISAVLNLPKLKYLYISSDMKQMAEEQLQGAQFKIEYCDN